MKIALFFLFAFVSTAVSAQYPDWKFFSEATCIHAIASEPGYLWAGSYTGLMKIDKSTGERTLYDKTNTPMPDAWVSQIAIDSKGAKWIGSWRKGTLSRFDNNGWTVYDTSNSPLKDFWPITRLDIDDNDNVWLCTGYIYTGLYKFDGNNWTHYTTSNSDLPVNYIDVVLCDGSNTWVSYYVGISRFDGVNWTTYTPENSNMAGETILDLKLDSSGNLWLLHEKGVEKFDGSTFQYYPSLFTNLTINSMSIAPDNKIWISCSKNWMSGSTGGILSFNGVEWEHFDTLNSGLQDINIGPINADEMGKIWYGCSDMGMVGSYEGTEWKLFDASAAKLDHSYVRQIVHTSTGITYIGTKSNHELANQPESWLTRFDWESWSPVPGYDDNSYTIAIGPDDELYIKNPMGILKFDGATWSDIPGTPVLMTTERVQPELYSMACDSSGGLWIDYIDHVDCYSDPQMGEWCTVFEGLAHFDGTSWQTYTVDNSPLPGIEITQVSVDQHGIVWVSTTGGMVRIDGTQWQVYTRSNSAIPSSYITSFAVDSAGAFWFGDFHYGLYRFDLSETIHYTHPTLGIYSSGNCKLATDIDGSIWMIEPMIRFNGANFRTFSYENSPRPDDGNITSVSVDALGNKWFGTQFGFLVYRTGGVISSEEPPIPGEIPVTISPNPFHDRIEIRTAEPLDQVTIEIYDSMLRRVFSKKFPGGDRFEVQPDCLPSGCYFIRLRSGNRLIATGKVIARGVPGLGY
ncbi:MAG: T9SS type A sorting domain-containing protein [Bacteroidales bacterium]|nr:T9SS type A sorting domain-containing protein [Bacteroidales bacterium]